MKKTSLVLMTAVALLFSCTKEGATGPSGKDGTNGTNGNANVISTNIITVNPGDWSAFGNGLYKDLSISSITSANVNNVTVLVYEEVTTNNWQLLPSLNGTLNSSVFFEVGIVTVLLSNTDGSQVVVSATNKYRVIVIP